MLKVRENTSPIVTKICFRRFRLLWKPSSVNDEGFRRRPKRLKQIFVTIGLVFSRSLSMDLPSHSGLYRHDNMYNAMFLVGTLFAHPAPTPPSPSSSLSLPSLLPQDSPGNQSIVSSQSMCMFTSVTDLRTPQPKRAAVTRSFGAADKKGYHAV